MSSSAATGLKIGQYSEGHLLKRSKAIVEEKAAQTKIFDPAAEERVPRFDQKELDLGRVLGRGGFCVVSEITKVTLLQGAASKHTSSEGNNEDRRGSGFGNVVQDRNFMQAHFLRNKNGGGGGSNVRSSRRAPMDCRYALKVLKPDATKDPQTFVNGIIDLAIEAKFLSVIRHPNIIKMRAISIASPYSRDFFVVLDRLYDILGRRIVTWRKQDIKGFKKMFDRKGKKKIAFWLERITVAYDLATALRHLHSLQVVYRDLKPDNIGFDVRGDVKIFDFGLAREFDETKRSKEGTFKYTGDTGSPRYMAPEVAMNKPYNETVDVYSFGILLWELCALETPFEGFNMNMFERKVVQGGGRPKPDKKWPAAISSLMEKSWNVGIATRPSMVQVCDALRAEIESKSDEEINDILDASRKSAMSMHNIYGAGAGGGDS